MRVLYLRSEQFFSAMMKSLQEKSMDQFKRQFQQVDALLIDDIQFFAGKNTTQEEFFHTFNTLFDGKQQIILTCDRYPREVENLEPRLKSRLGWGLSVAIEPPDFETRAAILTAKAERAAHGPARGRGLPDRQAHALERARPGGRAQHAGGALELHGQADHAGVRAGNAARPAARAGAGDLDQQYPEDRGRLLSAAHGGHAVEAADALLARPRQMAMALAKDLTEHSLPEIGDAFGGRDHTTVLHACRVIREMTSTDGKLHEDWDKLVRKLTE
jgi:chromosomal replication initiator protein